jgi:hypothetical protein
MLLAVRIGALNGNDSIVNKVESDISSRSLSFLPSTSRYELMSILNEGIAT